MVIEALRPGDVVMIKGSKGSKASLVVEAIKAAGQAVELAAKNDRAKEPAGEAR